MFAGAENNHEYQGKQMQRELGMQLYDFHARQYDPQIGRFWGIDPADQFPSGYTGMGNDPANMVDPTGMWADAIGIGSAGGYKHFEWYYVSQLRVTEYLDERQLEHVSFWMEKGKREVSNKFGDIGEGFVFLEKLEEFNKARAEKLNQEALVKKYDEGIGSEEESAEGRSDWDGDKKKDTFSDSQNDIVVEASDYANTLEDYYESNEGGTYHLSIWRFFDIVSEAKNSQAIEFHKAVYNEETGVYSVPVNLYKTDYWVSFGRATLMYKVDEGGNYKNPLNKIQFVGFRDTWDLDPKPWGTRPYLAEFVTRYYNRRLDGTNFHISFP